MADSQLLEAARRHARSMASSAGPWSRAAAAERAGLSSTRLRAMDAGYIARPTGSHPDDGGPQRWLPVDVLCAVVMNEIGEHVADNGLLRDLAKEIRIRLEIDSIGTDLREIADRDLIVLVPLERETADAVVGEAEFPTTMPNGVTQILKLSCVCSFREAYPPGENRLTDDDGNEFGFVVDAAGFVLDDDGTACFYQQPISATAARLLAAWGHH